MQTNLSEKKTFGTEREQLQMLTYVRDMLANYIDTLLLVGWGTCLRHCATNRKAAGSLPDGAIRIFH